MGKTSYYHTPGFILRNRDYLEADRLVCIFTEKYGKVSAIAKGVKKPKSSLRACTQPFCYSDLFLHQGKSLEKVYQGSIIDFFGNCRENMTSVMYLLYMAEILDKILPEHQPYPELFARTIRIVQTLEEKGPNPLWLRYFEAQVIEKMGFSPVLDHCVNCGETKELGKFFSIAEGGMLCRRCYQKSTTAVFSLNPETAAILKLLLRADIMLLERLQIKDQTMRQVEQFWEKYLEYHLERRFALKNAVSAFKKMMPQEKN